MIDIPIRVTGTDKLKEAQKSIDALNNKNVPTNASPDRIDKIVDRAFSRAQSYRKEMESAQKATAQMARDMQTMRTTEAESLRMRRQSQKEAQQFWDDHDRKRTRRTAAEQYQDIHGNRGRTATSGGGGESDTAGGGSNFAGLKKALGWGLAAAGGFSLLGFLSQSRAKYQQSVGHEANLWARGIRGGYNDGQGMGVSQLEYMGLMENMSQSTGITGKDAGTAGRLTAAFSRRFGVDMNSVAGLRSGIYNATGDNSGLPNAVISAMASATKKGVQEAKLPELLTLVGRNTQMTASAMGGAGISKEQLAAATNLAITGLTAKGDYAQYAKSGEFASFMQNGFKGAGSPWGDILTFQALGGYEGTWDFEKVHKMNLGKQLGPMGNPKAFAEVISRLGGKDQTPETLAGKLESAYSDHFKDNAQGAVSLAKMITSGHLDNVLAGNISLKDDLDRKAKSGDGDAIWLQKQLNSNPAMAKLELEAKREAEHIEAGKALNDAFGKFETAILALTHSILSTDMAQRMVGGMEKLGVAAEKLVNLIDHPGSTAFKSLLDSTPDIFPDSGSSSYKMPWYAVSKGLMGGIEKQGYRVNPSSGKRKKGDGMRLFAEMLAGINPSIGNVVDPWDSAHESGKAQDFSVDVSDRETGKKRRASREELIAILAKQGVSIGKDNRGRNEQGSYLLEHNQNGWYVHMQDKDFVSQKPKDHATREDLARHRISELNKKYTSISDRKKHYNEYMFEVENALTGGIGNTKADADNYKAGKMAAQGADGTSTFADALLVKIHTVLEKIEQKTPDAKVAKPMQSKIISTTTN